MGREKRTMGTDWEHYRSFLKDTIRRTVDASLSDQGRGVPPPPLERPYEAGSERIDLLPKDQWRDVSPPDLLTAMASRRSVRQYSEEPLSVGELSFLLWATQGIRQHVNEGTAYRIVPSAGCRHALETYLCILNVAGLDQGIYRYLPVEHQLLVVLRDADLAGKLVASTFSQSFIGRSAATFVWTAVPYRMEWRYHIASHKVIALEAGHVCQNLYLAVSAVGGGTCAVAAYHQERMDELLGVDGKEEFTIYLAPVGKTAGM
jgi:SagB-type dehydrogenase family enzyme